MNKQLHFITFLFFLFFISCEKDDVIPNPPDPGSTEDALYFPPLSHSEWETMDVDSLGWNDAELDNLLNYLEEKKTKGFIILKNGKIVVEEYFNNHSINANWPWYSCAKSLTSTLTGVAVKEGYLDLDVTSSTYLGNNWSSLPTDKQDLIKVRHHLSMSTGLKSNINDFIPWTCTAPICMQYQADANTRWTYHQGAFTLSQDIITRAVGLNFKQYLKEKILDPIGMNGSWDQLFDVRIFSSTTRSMARFGLLALNKGSWNTDTIYTENYYNLMTNSSQDMNHGYGLLWWLNGKSDFMGTKDQTVYSNWLIPNGPEDMFCALGAQDQKIYVVPSQNLVIVRSGEPAGHPEFASSSFDNELWTRLNRVME